MKPQSICCSRFLNLFFVYLPTILIFTLITIVYFSYLFAYIIYLINPNAYSYSTTTTSYDSPYIFSYTSDPESAKLRGYILLSLVSLFFSICLLSLLRVVLMDPGFIANPLEFEYQILLKNTKAIKTKGLGRFFSNFDELVSENPLTQTDSLQLTDAVQTLFNQTMTEQIIDEVDQIIEQKQNITEHSNCYANNNTNCSKNPYNILANPFNKYIGIDFTKIPLCSSCFRMKIERSHHCRQCGKCVKKMDHHCPWLATCIGFRNYKYFLLTHLHGIIATSIVFFSLFEALINYSLNSNTSLALLITIFFCWVCDAGLLSFLLWLFTVNWTLMFKGETVIESLDRERFPSAHSVNIYDLGVYQNFITVFGRNPLLWFIPFCANEEGDGVTFVTNLELDMDDI